MICRYSGILVPNCAKVPPVQKDKGFCGSCKKLRCKICEHIVSADSFKSITTHGPTLLDRKI